MANVLKYQEILNLSTFECDQIKGWISDGEISEKARLRCRIAQALFLGETRTSIKKSLCATFDDIDKVRKHYKHAGLQIAIFGPFSYTFCATKQNTDKKMCIVCRKSFDVSIRAKRIRGRAKYCSRQCYNQRCIVTTSENKACAFCMKIFVVSGKSPVANSKKRLFCSISCAARYRWAKQSKNDADLFWKRVDKKRENECWEWTGAKTRGNYGRMKCKGNEVRSHRMAYTLTNGPIRPGMSILHSCDNPPCCNPSHLREGTCADNSADAVARGRLRGLHRDVNHASKISAANAAIMAKEYLRLPKANNGKALPGTVAKMADRWGLKATTISQISRSLGQMPCCEESKKLC